MHACSVAKILPDIAVENATKELSIIEQNNYNKQQQHKDFTPVVAADSTAEDIACGNIDYSMYNMNNEIANNYNNTRQIDIPVSTSSQSSDKKFDLIDHLINDARRLVELNDLFSKLSSGRPILNFIPFQPNFNASQFNTPLKSTQSPFNVNSRLPFGFRVHICRTCLEGPIQPLFYPANEQETSQVLHKCRPERIAAIEHIVDKQKHLTELKDFSLRLLNFIITGSAVNRYNYLIALSLSNFQEVVKLPNQEKPALPVSFWYNQEAQVELNLDTEDPQNIHRMYDHWAVRATTQGVTQLTDKEILEFLQLIGGMATFAFFKIKRKGSLRHYFMMLSNTLPPNR